MQSTIQQETPSPSEKQDALYSMPEFMSGEQGSQRTDRVLDLLVEYTEKIKNITIESSYRTGANSNRTTLSVYAGFCIIITLSIYTLRYGFENSSFLAFALIVPHLLFSIYNISLRREDAVLRNISELLDRLDPIRELAVQLHEHGELDPLRRAELNLRLKELEAQIEQVERKRK